MIISNMYSNEVNNEVKFQNTMIRCEHILSVRRAQKRHQNLILKGRNSPRR